MTRTQVNGVLVVFLALVAISALWLFDSPRGWVFTAVVIGYGMAMIIHGGNNNE